MSVWQWKQNGRFPVSAQLAGEELSRIQNKYNGITPKSVVDESRPEDAILHNCFEWDDKTAAEAYREVQAKEIIRSVIVVKIDESKDEEIEPVRAFVSIMPEQETKPRYVSVEKVMTNDKYREQLLESAKNEMISFKKKYGHLVELAEVFKIIDKFVA